MRDQLPVVMAEDPGLDEFLEPFDRIAGDLYEFIEAKEHFFDLAVAPSAMVRHLARQIGVEIEGDLDEAIQRRVAITGARTFSQRGTRISIERNIHALTGCGVRVIDPGGITSAGRPQVPRAADSDGADRAVDPEWPNHPPPIDTEPPSIVRILLESYGDASAAMIRPAIERELTCMTPYQIEVSEEWAQ